MLGWKYIDTAEEAQRYKVGKYILETKRVVVGSVWDGGDVFEFEEEEEEEDQARVEEKGLGHDEEEGPVDEEDEEDEEDEVTSPASRSLNSDITATTSAITASQDQHTYHTTHNTRIQWSSDTHTAFNARKSNRCDDESDGNYSDDDNDEVLFDSQDEDECDDLFAGMWNPQVVRLRRDSKRRDSARMVR